eukprot:6279572-Pyramimonas_sp.AAC.1
MFGSTVRSGQIRTQENDEPADAGSQRQQRLEREYRVCLIQTREDDGGGSALNETGRIKHLRLLGAQERALAARPDDHTSGR